MKLYTIVELHSSVSQGVYAEKGDMQPIPGLFMWHHNTERHKIERYTVNNNSPFYATLEEAKQYCKTLRNYYPQPNTKRQYAIIEVTCENEKITSFDTLHSMDRGSWEKESIKPESLNAEALPLINGCYQRQNGWQSAAAMHT